MLKRVSITLHLRRPLYTGIFSAAETHSRFFYGTSAGGSSSDFSAGASRHPLSPLVPLFPPMQFASSPPSLSIQSVPPPPPQFPPHLFFQFNPPRLHRCLPRSQPVLAPCRQSRSISNCPWSLASFFSLSLSPIPHPIPPGFPTLSPSPPDSPPHFSQNHFNTLNKNCTHPHSELWAE